MAASLVLTSARGVLSLLKEPDDQLRVHALQQLNLLVDHHWVEIVGDVTEIESLSDDDQFQNRTLAALVASKVYYHLEELNEALKYALSAGDLFDVNAKNEYVETLLAKCIDEYISIQVKLDESKQLSEDEAKLSGRVESIVNRMFARCFADGEYKQALGIALEARRLDMVEQSIMKSGDVFAMMSHCLQLARTVVVSRSFRHRVLNVLVQLYQAQPEPDYLSMCQCLFFLNNHQQVAAVLAKLLRGEPNHVLMAYQVAFDLTENQNVQFLLDVSAHLAELAGAGSQPEAAAASTTATATIGDDSESGRIFRLRQILAGNVSTTQYLQFLYTHDKSDPNVIKVIKDKLESRNAITHNATVMAHSFMHAGATVDSFLRNNLEWLGKANNWAKFSATASIGVIHMGHHSQSQKILEPYLPQGGQAASPYQEGGALYALGLIHANHGGEKLDYLLDALRNAGNNEIVQHGACLGIGLVALGMNDKADRGATSIFEVLKNVVFNDSAIAGEAAGIAMGMVLLGTGKAEAIAELLAYAHDTKHEKIIRGLAMGMALICYGREEAADVVIEQLVRDKDPILRYGGMYAIAMAYVGTANNSAIKQLLHIAVSDTSNDVRRAAVTSLGFVLCNAPQQVPRMVSLLAESFNPHVRYGACFAVGIACAGSGMTEALDLLEPLLSDRVDFVRQGAYIATAMVLIQHSAGKEPRVDAFRQSMLEAAGGKNDTMAKLGAILAAGIIDAGGRNVTLSLLSSGGHKKAAAIVGMALFPQFWYWYPLVPMLALAFTPTAVIGLNKDLKIPAEFSLLSNAPPSHFAYPAPLELKKEEKKKKVPTAQLSAARARMRLRRARSATDMETDEKPDKATAAGDHKPGDDAKDTTDGTKEEKKDEVKAEEASLVLTNPARVTPTQQSFITVPVSQRYRPLTKRMAGFVMLTDTNPQEPENLVNQVAPKVGQPGVGDNEPAVPADFQFSR